MSLDAGSGSRRPNTLSILGNVLLTILALSGVVAATFGIIYFAVTRMTWDDKNAHLPISIALIPIFGAIGGIVGNVITKDNRIHLARFSNSSTLELGVVGDAITGLGGAAAVMFVFSVSEFSLTPASPGKTVVLVSITFLAGAFGPAVVQLLGKRFLRRLDNLARDVDIAKNETASVKVQLDRQQQVFGPRLFLQMARDALQDNLFTQTLEFVDQALSIDPAYAGAYIVRGRAYKRLNRMPEALEAVRKALEVKPGYPAALYNRACYNCITGADPAIVVQDLLSAFEAEPDFRKSAAEDSDLQRVMPILKERGILPATAGSSFESKPVTNGVLEI